MKKPSVLLVAVLALVVTESALAADLPLPGVSTPALPLPTVGPVTIPPVVVPTLPAVPALPQLPAVPRLPGGATAPAVPSVPGLPAAPGRSPSASTGGMKPAGGAVGSGPSSSPSAADPGSRAPAGGTRGGGTRRAVARVRRERRLRTTIRRLQDCLGGLRRLERRVLVLRAGIGAGPARSRGRVARRLDVSIRRVARIERRGLRTLRGLARTGRCGSSEAAGGQAATGGVTAGFPPGRQGQLSTASRDRSAVKAERQSSNDARPVQSAEKQGWLNRLPAAIVGGVDLTLPLVMLLAAVPLVLGARAARRSGTV